MAASQSEIDFYHLAPGTEYFVTGAPSGGTASNIKSAPNGTFFSLRNTNGLEGYPNLFQMRDGALVPYLGQPTGKVNQLDADPQTINQIAGIAPLDFAIKPGQTADQSKAAYDAALNNNTTPKAYLDSSGNVIPGQMPDSQYKPQVGFNESTGVRTNADGSQEQYNPGTNSFTPIKTGEAKTRQVTGTLPDGSQATFVDEATARQYGATNINSSSPSNAGSAQPAAPGQTGTGGGGGIASTLPSTGNPQLDALLSHLDDFVQQNIANGQKINPNIELTPDEVQKFIDKASGEVAPYYQNIIRSVKDDLTKNLQYMQKQYDLDKQQKEAQFKSDLGNQRESAAGAGLTFSGSRNLGEQTAAATQDRTLQSSALAAGKAAQDAISSTEQKIGSRNLSDLQIPGMTDYTASLEGNGGFNTGRSLDFSPLGGVTGSLEYAQAGDTRQLSDFYKQQEVQKRSLNFAG